MYGTESVACYVTPETTEDQTHLLETLTPSPLSDRLNIRGTQHPRANKIVELAWNHLGPGMNAERKRVPGWSNLVNPTIWGHLMDRAAQSGATTHEEWEVHLLDQPDILPKLRQFAAELDSRWNHCFGNHLTAQVSLDAAASRIIDSTWVGYLPELRSDELLNAHLSVIEARTGKRNLRVRRATEDEDRKMGLDKVIEDEHGNPILGVQDKSPGYYTRTDRDPIRFRSLRADKIRNIGENNRWLLENPTALTVLYISTEDVLAGRLVSLNSNPAKEVCPSGTTLINRLPGVDPLDRLPTLAHQSAPRIAEWAGVPAVLVRPATQEETDFAGLAAVVTRLDGSPLIGIQAHPSSYFTPARSLKPAALKRNNIRAANRWLTVHPDALTVFFVSTDDITNGHLRSLRNTNTVEVVPNHVTLIDRRTVATEPLPVAA